MPALVRIGQHKRSLAAIHDLLTHQAKSDVHTHSLSSRNVICLEICDYGPGFPPDFDWQTAANTGLGLIDNVARCHLRGSVTYANCAEGGGTVVVRFPLTTLHLEQAHG